MVMYRLLEEERLRRLRQQLGMAEPTEQNAFDEYVPVQRRPKDFKPETEETLQRRYFAEHPTARPEPATGVGPPPEEFRPRPGRSFLEYLTNAEQARIEQETQEAAVLGGAVKGLVEPVPPEFVSSPLGALAFAPGAGFPIVGGPSMAMAKAAFGGLKAVAPGAVKGYVTAAARGPAAQAVVPVRQATTAGRVNRMPRIQRPIPETADDMANELDELAAEIEGLKEMPPERAPAFGTTERGDYEAARRIRSEEGRPVFPRSEQIRVRQERIAELNRALDEKLAVAPEAGQVGAIQKGMGIGETPAQGGLFENLPGEAQKLPLADAENLAAQQARRQALAAGQAEMPVGGITRANLMQEAKGFKSADDFIRSIQKDLGVYDAAGNRVPMSQHVRQPLGEAKLTALEAQPIGKSGGGWMYKAIDIWDEAHSVAKAPATAVPARGRATEAVVPKAAKAAEVTKGAWETGAPRPFAFDPNSTVNQGRFRLLPPVTEKGRYITRQSTTPGVSYIMDTKANAIQSVRFAKDKFTEAQASQWWEANKARLQPSAAGQGLPPPATAAPTLAGPSVGQQAAPMSRSAVKTPAQATQRVKAIQQEGKNAPESILSKDAKEAHIELGAADGPRPPIPTRPVAKGAQPPPDDPDGIVHQIAEKATQGERPDQTLLRLHEAAIGNEARRNSIIVRDGNTKLKALGIGVMRRGQLIPKTQDITELDALYNVLHNPTKVASGEMQIPKGYEAIYHELRDLTDWEQAARLDFDPAMAMVDDYFYRGWKPPEGAFADVSQGRPLVKTPAFKKPRIDATYQEMRDAGFEPLFWNPYQQWGLSRMQGAKYREQMELVGYLKGMGDDFARPHAGGPIPEGWRVPEVGPAFEGKPFATLDAAGDPATMYTRRWIVPDRVANILENIYGKRPDLGKLTIGAKSLDPLSVIDFLTFVPKRAKLMLSLFQQVDFLTRAGAGSWTRMVDALFAGQPIEAAKALARYPKTVLTIIQSNFSPGLRQSLARQLDSTAPLVKGRPGVHLKGVSEAGLSTFDPAMFRWEQMDKVVREVAQETGVLGKGRNVLRAVGDLESMMRRGLFEGVYPAAMITDIRKNVAPMVARMYPKLNDAQLNGTIARIINKKYSSIPASQSVLQNRVLRETLRRVFFSIGESEGLLRQAASTVVGPNKKFWMKHWLGTYLFVIATASTIHFASTGKPLPKERFSPISKDKWGPLPFGYNTRFASPTIPFKGRGGSELTLDVVGQMDTALRILNPGSFITSRESIPIRAGVNQVSGTDFFGTPIDDVGPGGIISRTAQLILDLFSPIGVGGIASEVARRNIPGAERVVSEGETRLGMTGLAVQATGLNLRAATREQRLLSTLGPQAKKTLGDLDKLGLDLGYVTRNFDMKLGVKGGEITLTSEQREQLQWLTDDTVVAGLQQFFANPLFQVRSDEENKEKARSNMEASRAAARAKFRTILKTQQVGQGQPTRPAPAQPVAPSDIPDAARMRKLREELGMVPVGAR